MRTLAVGAVAVAVIAWLYRRPKPPPPSLLEGDEFDRIVARVGAADRAMPDPLRQRFYRGAVR